MKNVNFLHPELLITLIAGLVLLMAGCGGSRETYIPSAGSPSAPFVIDGLAASAGSATVSIETSVAITSGVPGTVPLSTSYYKVTNLSAAAEYYAVSFSGAQSDINIKVGNSAALFDGTIPAADKCENAEASPASEGCVAMADTANGELFVMIQNNSSTANQFRLNVKFSDSSASTNTGSLSNPTIKGTLTGFAVAVDGNNTAAAAGAIQGSSFYRIDLNGGGSTLVTRQVTLGSLYDNADLKIYNGSDTEIASSANAGLASEGPLTVTTLADGILKFQIIAKNLNPNGLRGTITIAP